MGPASIPPRVRDVLAALLLLASTGCASMQDTLAQGLARERWEVCKSADPEIGLFEIRPDGQIWFTHGGSVSLAAAQQCLRRAADEQARRGVTSAPRVASPPPSVGIAAAPQVPRWRIGDEWAYGYTRSGESGIWVWSVERMEQIDGIECYVIRSGPREILYRASDYALLLERVGGVVDIRATPPRTGVAWPLSVGKSWEQTFTEHRVVDRQTTTTTYVRLWRVESEEDVTVPAGTFRAFKVVQTNKVTGAPVNEVWYAPDLKQAVKAREFQSAGIRERELIAFKLKR